MWTVCMWWTKEKQRFLRDGTTGPHLLHFYFRLHFPPSHVHSLCGEPQRCEKHGVRIEPWATPSISLESVMTWLMAVVSQINNNNRFVNCAFAHEPLADAQQRRSIGFMIFRAFPMISLHIRWKRKNDKIKWNLMIITFSQLNGTTPVTRYAAARYCRSLLNKNYIFLFLLRKCSPTQTADRVNGKKRRAEHHSTRNRLAFVLPENAQIHDVPTRQCTSGPSTIFIR